MVADGEKAEGQRVVVFGSYAPSLTNFRGPLIREMARAGHRVFAMAPGLTKEISDKIQALGGIPVEIDLGRGSLNPFRALATTRQFRASIRKLRPDVVIAYTVTPIVLGATAAKLEGVSRFVALITGLGYAFTGGREPKRLLSRLLGLLMYRRALRRADIAVFQNPDDREEFGRLGLLPGRLPTGIVNGSGVDLDRFRPSPLPHRLSFLMISRFLKDKGVREYGEAAARLKRSHPEVEVALAGWLDDSPDAIGAADLDRFASAGLRLLGRLEDVRPAIAASSVYVLPSYREGTPRSVLEAMAMGRAIITTDAPGCRETVIEGDNGFLVPPRDADSLHQAMLRFIEQPDLAAPMGLRSRQLAEQKYDVVEVSRSLMNYAGL
jgi:glycosyltransferase involved in cell wall biosynthesis